MTWSAVKGATGYEVFYSTISDSSTATLLGSTNLINIIKELTAGVLYYFWIKAKADSVVSGFSNVVSVTVMGIEVVLVEAGSFNMGSNDGYNDEKPVHRVTLTKNYYIGYL